MSESSTVTVIIVNFNTRQALCDCLSSLERAAGDVKLQTIVVDNASSDGSADMVKSEFPRVELLMNSANRGFASAVNQAAERTLGNYIFLLNPDTWVARRAIERLVKTASLDEKIGVVGAQLTTFGGDYLNSVLAPPTLTKEFFNLLPELKSFLFPGFVRNLVRKRRQTHRGEMIEVPAVSGGAMLIRTSAFTGAGGFDERFFVYHEEVDLCIRLSKAGWRIVFEPRAVVLHHNALATGFRAERLPTEPVLGWRLGGTRVLFEKHGSPNALARFTRLAQILLKSRAGLARLRSRISGPSGENWRRRAEELEMAAFSLSKPRE